MVSMYYYVSYTRHGIIYIYIIKKDYWKFKQYLEIIQLSKVILKMW